MTTESKRGSNGGTARKEKLSPERRSEIAKQAAARRWANIKKTKEDASNPASESYVLPDSEIVNVIPAAPEPPVAPEVTLLPPTLQPIPQKPPKPKKTRLPKAFGNALVYAERRLVEAMKERADAMSATASLNVEIQYLIDNIKSLKGNQSGPVYPALDPTINYPPPNGVGVAVPQQTPIPPIPMAHGGAIGGPIQEQQDLPEDYFLRDTVVGGKFI